MKRIAIHGVPRSGTTWLGALFDSCPSLRYVFQPLFSHAFKDRLNRESSAEEIVSFFAEIAASDDPFINQFAAKCSGLVPNFDKRKIDTVAYKEARYHHLLEHLLATDVSLQAVLIIRNPLSVLASWREAPKEFDSSTMNFQTEWEHAAAKNGGRVEEFYGFQKWKEFAWLAHRLQHRFADRCYLVNYRRLLDQTTTELRKCFEFCGLPWSQQTQNFIDDHLSTRSCSSTSCEHPYGVFRISQTDDKWRSVLPQEIVGAIREDLADTELARYLD